MRTMRVVGLGGVVLAILAHVAPAHAQSPDAVAERQRAVEAALLPAIVIAGDSSSGYTVRERMLHHGVPGVSIAVINDGSIEWAEGYGVKRAGSADSIGASTLFQAASISKPVAAAAMLQLVEDELLDLDADINDQLRSWHLPENRFTAGRPVTLRAILTHTAGLTVHGFPGYASGDSIPTAAEVLDGAGNTDPVRADTTPGTMWRYSGGGYTVAQVLVEDVTGDSFAAVMQREVLDPFGMRQSTYVQPLPASRADDAAVAHGDDGAPVDGLWHTYPEQAAAGLWTTPADLARFALGIRAAYRGEPGAALEPANAREMLSEHMSGWGLGPSVAGAGDSLRFSHGGANAGYRAFFVLYPATGDGVAVMANSDAGGGLMMEMVRSVARVYDWPDYHPESRSVVDVDTATLRAYVGEYRLTPDVLLRITRAGEELFVQAADQRRVVLQAQSETEFFPENDEFQLTFVRDAAGRATHLILHLNGRDMEAKRQEPLEPDSGI
ncbi:MAG: serine hydrolase [Gemmatimonadaceae bacterium]